MLVLTLDPAQYIAGFLEDNPDEYFLVFSLLDIRHYRSVAIHFSSKPSGFTALREPGITTYEVTSATGETVELCTFAYMADQTRVSFNAPAYKMIRSCLNGIPLHIQAKAAEFRKCIIAHDLSSIQFYELRTLSTRQK